MKFKCLWMISAFSYCPLSSLQFIHSIHLLFPLLGCSDDPSTSSIPSVDQRLLCDLLHLQVCHTYHHWPQDSARPFLVDEHEVARKMFKLNSESSNVIYLIYTEKYGCSYMLEFLQLHPGIASNVKLQAPSDQAKSRSERKASHSHHWCDGWHCFGNVASADGFSICTTEGLLSKSLRLSWMIQDTRTMIFVDFQNTHFNFNTLTNLNPRKRPLTHRHLPNHGGRCEKCAGFAFHHSLSNAGKTPRQHGRSVAVIFFLTFRCRNLQTSEV